jgi:uncharacterized protein YeaO (DUF488 family)
MNKDSVYKIWTNNWYHNDPERFDSFHKWINSRNIIKKLNLSCWRQVTKNGLRGLRYPKYTEDDWPLKDHTTLWKAETGKKYIICHPYWGYPPTWEQFEKYYNEKSKNCDFEEHLNKLIDWCNERNLKVKFYKSSESWYYPNSTIMYEISERE